MNAFNHYATLMVVCFMFGYATPKLVSPAMVLPVCLIGGFILGLVWRKITGYNPNKEKENE